MRLAARPTQLLGLALMLAKEEGGRRKKKEEEGRRRKKKEGSQLSLKIYRPSPGRWEKTTYINITKPHRCKITFPPMKLRINKLLFPQIYVSKQKTLNLKRDKFASKSEQ
jgi:hypothetical protein